jgi:hypothetical protein
VSDRATFDLWPSKLNRLLEIGEQLAEAKADLENLNNIKATVVAMAMKASGESAVAAQQREAHASESYRQWCLDAYAATKRYEGLRLRYQAALLWFEMARSTESSKREEMRLAR